MNIILYGMIGLAVIPILFGLILGFMRGSRRAVLRLVLVLLCAVLAYFLCGVVAEKLMTTEVTINGEKAVLQDFLKDMLVGSMSESMANALADLALPIVQSLLKVIVFLLLFGVAMFLTWLIVFPLCKLFVKKGKKPHRLLGGLFGVVQGVVVALCVCIVFNGLIVQANNLVAAASELSDITTEAPSGGEENGEGEPELEALSDVDEDEPPKAGDEDPAEQDPSEQDPAEGEEQGKGDSDGGIFGALSSYSEMINGYTQSKFGKLLNKIGSKPFDLISQVKKDGKTKTLAGQIDAIHGLTKMAKELSKLVDFNFAQMFAEGNIDSLQDIFNQLDKVMGGLSKESKEAIGGLLTAVGDELGVDLSGVDFSEVDFKKEGQIFADLASYKDMDFSEVDSQEEIDAIVDDIIDNLVDSDIILGVLTQNTDVDFGSQLQEATGSDEHVKVIEDKIQALEDSGNYTQDKIDALRDIFGLKNKSGSEQPQPEAAQLTQAVAA